MRDRLLLILVIFVFCHFSSQQKLEGNYSSEIGETLKLNSDYSFDYKLNVHTGFCWNVGTWKIVDKKYLLLTIIEIKDKIIGEEKYVLSGNKVSDSITLQNHAVFLLQGGGQSKSLPPTKFLIKNGILYPYSKEGKIKNTKIKSLMNGEMIRPWFKKITVKLE